MLVPTLGKFFQHLVRKFSNTRQEYFSNTWNIFQKHLEEFQAKCPSARVEPLPPAGEEGFFVLRWREEGGRDESERRRAESQWIVAARPLCHLQYPVAYLSRLQRILPAARWKLYFKAARTARPPNGLGQRHVPLGARGPLLLVGKRAAGERVASSPDSDLEAFSHNPAHGSFAPLAFQPSAMTNCANQRFLSY